MDLPCISLYEPWASFIMWGWKSIETRTHRRFQSLTGKTIAIHASLKYDHDALQLALPYMTIGQKAYCYSILSKRYILVRGCVIMTARVVEHRALSPKDSMNAMIDCSEVERFGLILDQVTKLNYPIKVEGRQGIFFVNIPDDAIPKCLNLTEK